MKKNITAFIFARGGSKGLPNKNLLNINGIPLLGHAVKKAKQAGIKDVYVSSDSDLILDTAIKFGAEIIKRPDYLATDTASEIDAWKHAINIVSKIKPFEVFVSIPCTAPLGNAVDINNAINLLDDKTDLVITVTEANRNPYFNMVSIDSNGYCKILLDNSNIIRRQDAPKVYDVTTVVYVAKRNYISEVSNILSGKVKACIVPKERSIDIDDEIDFYVAKTLYERNKK